MSHSQRAISILSENPGAETIPRLPIGIIAGSGPEAGADLWLKVIEKNRELLGESFRGDIDAPKVFVSSIPVLGLSMELDRYEGVVWESLKQAAIEQSEYTVAFAIACNTLNYFSERIEALSLPSRLISFQKVVEQFVRARGLSRIDLLGSAPTMSMTKWSAYTSLSEIVDVETPDDVQALHQLIHDVKRFGPQHEALRPRFRNILSHIESETVLLACTELPLIADFPSEKQLVDVTELVASALVTYSFAGQVGGPKSVARNNGSTGKGYP